MRNYGMNDVYFFDTYAIVEIMKGNQNYSSFLNVKFIVTVFNLVELHYKLLRDFNEKFADSILEEYPKHAVPISLDIIKDANKFKLKNKNMNLSASDAIGYTTALKHNIKFVTGDKQFKNFENVEFIK